jgi:hypothetical protein
MTIRHLLLSLLLVVPAAARDVTVRLLADRAPDGVAEVVLAAGGKKAGPIPLPVNAPSGPLAVAARAFEVMAGDVSLAKVALPEAGDSFLVLLLSSEKGFQPVVLAADPKKFKGGDLYLHNGSTRTVFGNVGTSDFTLEPGKGSFLKPAGASPEKIHEVLFKVRYDKGERLLSEARWPVDEQLRTYVFFFNKPGTDRVDSRAVEEFVAGPAGR